MKNIQKVCFLSFCSIFLRKNRAIKKINRNFADELKDDSDLTQEYILKV